MRSIAPSLAATLAVVLTVSSVHGNNTNATTNNGASVALACCPFCSAPSLTLTEQFSEADAVVLVQWVGGEPSTEVDPGTTEFEVLDIPRNKGIKLTKGKNLKVPRYRAAKKGDMYVLMGRQGAKFEWDTTLPVTAKSYEYMSKAPSPDIATRKRLEYFMKFLEDPDEMIAMDAYGEFANAPYADITPLRKKLPRKKLLKWVTDAKTSPTRLGLYGLLLGLCGTQEDAKEMEKFIIQPSEDYRLGLDGVLSGYLLITGPKGLDVIDRTKLAATMKLPDGEVTEVPFSEAYAVVSAIRFMWSEGGKAIPRERLKKSMRLLLKQPRLVDLVIPDLARWKDWEIAPKLYEMYGKDEFDQRAIKLAIVKFLIHCSKDTRTKKAAESTEPVELPKHAVLAKQLLDKIKEADPKTVRDAKRTMIF